MMQIKGRAATVEPGFEKAIGRLPMRLGAPERTVPAPIGSREQGDCRAAAGWGLSTHRDENRGMLPMLA